MPLIQQGAESIL